MMIFLHYEQRSEIPDGVPASTNVLGDDPTDGGLTTLLQYKLIRSSGDITLNVDGGEAMLLVMRFEKASVSVDYLWKRKPFLSGHYSCTFKSFEEVDACSRKIFKGSVKAARFLKYNYKRAPR
jgi:hypothetical protein